MTEYIHDEWCDTRLAMPSECNCYVAVIRRLEARIEALEHERTEILAAVHEACYSEYMSCPLCSGHIGHGDEWHDSDCPLSEKEKP